MHADYTEPPGAQSQHSFTTKYTNLTHAKKKKKKAWESHIELHSKSLEEEVVGEL